MSVSIKNEGISGNDKMCHITPHWINRDVEEQPAKCKENNRPFWDWFKRIFS